MEAGRQPLFSNEADRAVRIARIVAQAQQVFSRNPTYAMEWMRKPQLNLAGCSPLQMLSTESGTRPPGRRLLTFLLDSNRRL